MNPLSRIFGKIFNGSEKTVPENYILTKSRFLQYNKCPRLVWFQVNARVDRKHDHKFGYESDKVRKFARLLFRDQIFQYNTADKNINIETTRYNLLQGKPVFNAALGAGEIYSQIDILEPDGDGWNIYELKNSPTMKKKDFIQELVFQKHLAESFGLKINNCYVIIIDSGMAKDGEVDPEKVFIRYDLTAEVTAVDQQIFREKLDEITGYLEQPVDDIAIACRSPKTCRAAALCYTDLGDGDIFHLREGTDQSIKYYQDGIRFIRQIPEEDELSYRQTIQVQTEKSGIPHIDKAELAKYISSIRYPLYYLDFETINSSIPVYEKSRPFQHIPFQFSLHIQQEENGDIVHHGYIDSNRDDPRREILEILSSLIKPGGSIICFEENFEKRCLKESKEMFPEYNHWYESVVGDFRDLATPFKSFHYYHPAQKGSTSLKKVVTALTGSGYEDLNIREGYTANYEFLRLKTGELEADEQKSILANLEEYCKQDTWSLHLVLGKLKELTER